MDKEDFEKKPADIELMEDMIAEDMEQRQKVLWRHKIPEGRTLEEALNTLTKAELDDIRFNLRVAGVSSLKKKELAHALVAEIVEFSKRWLLTIGIEQYNIITHLSRKNGISTVLDMEDNRIDYMRSLGMVFSGLHDGEKAWYVPVEILAVYQSLNNEKYRQEIAFNDEVARLSTGMLFYYGYMNYDKMYEAVKKQLDSRPLEFIDFMGIIINASCWLRNIVMDETGAVYYTVLNADNVIRAQSKKADLDYCSYTYDELYAAGEKDFAIVNDEYKALANLLHSELEQSEQSALEITTEAQIILQNNESVNEVLAYFQQCFTIPNREVAARLLECVEAMSLVTPVWAYKGHLPKDLDRAANASVHIQQTRDNVVKFVPRSSKIGRNDPCPCGSGKKYKKCCMDKEY